MQTVREEHSADPRYKIPGIVSESPQGQTADSHIPRSPTKETDSNEALLWTGTTGPGRTIGELG